MSATHLGRRMRTAQSASALGGLIATRKHQSCLKLVIGKWNVTTLTGKKHEVVKKAKRHSLDIVDISSTYHHAFKTVKWEDGWKHFYSSVELANFVQVGVGYL